MPNVRQALFPYGMARNPDGSWTFFNRNYKPVGVTSDAWAEWDDPRHKISLTGLGPATLAKLDCSGAGEGERIHFYDDATNPEASPANLKKYIEKLQLLLKLEGSP